jgi:hypothetical protein
MRTKLDLVPNLVDLEGSQFRHSRMWWFDIVLVAWKSHRAVLLSVERETYSWALAVAVTLHQL